MSEYIFLADSGQHNVATDDETDLIEAIGEFDLQAGDDNSYNSSSQNSLALNWTII